jgi:hypothetical protein
VLSVLSWVAGTLAVVLCIGAGAKYWGEFTKYHTELSVWMLIMGLACSAMAGLSKAAGWFVLMSSLGNPIRLLTALRAYSYSQVVAYVPGKVPVLLVRMQICQEDGALPSKVFAGTALEIILGLVCALTIWLSTSFLVPVSEEFLRIWYLVLLILMLPTLHPKAIMTLMRLYYRWRGTSWEHEVPHMDLASILRPGGLYFLGWLFYGLGGYFILRSVVPNPVGPVASAMYVAGISNFAWAFGYVFFIAPGGLGATEASLTWFLQPWLPLGVAVLVSLLTRICRIGIVFSFAAIWWIVHRWRSALMGVNQRPL